MAVRQRILGLLLGTALVAVAEAADKPTRRSNAAVIAAEVPKMPLRAWLCRPGAQEMSLSLFAQEALEVRVAWALANGNGLGLKYMASS